LALVERGSRQRASLEGWLERVAGFDLPEARLVASRPSPRRTGDSGMGWLRVITALVRPARELIEVFGSSAGAESRRPHSRGLAPSFHDLSALEQFAAEFEPRTERTRWDSFIDGLNRVPRPLITLGVLAFFLLAPLDPLRFAQIARAYELMPEGFWALLSIIVAFYFGGRMQLKRQDMAIRGGALEVVRELLALQRAARAQDAQRAQPAGVEPPIERRADPTG
jgi:Holin of 3TMs, for gene-transfer release